MSIHPTSSATDLLAKLTAPGGEHEIADTAIDGVLTRAYATGPRTLTEVLRASVEYGEETYLIYAGESCTFREHLTIVAGLADVLARRYDVHKGDRVAIAMRNYPEFSFFFWAAQALGAIVVPLNAWWTETEMRQALADSEPAVCVLDGERLERMEKVLGAVGGLRGAVSVRTAHAVHGVDTFADLRSSFARDASLPAADVGPDDISTILYTSGTTGTAKGAALTHRNHCTNIGNQRLAGALARGGQETDRAADRGGMPVAMPMFHIGGLLSLYIGLSFGLRLALMYRWDADEALALIERHGLTQFWGVVAMSQSLLGAPAGATRDLSALQVISAGAGAVPPELVLRLGDHFEGRVAAATGYGMTETTGSIATIAGAEYRDHPDSVGRPTPVNAVRVIDTAGRELPCGEAGELCVRGPNVMKGYWKQPDATEAAFAEGWYRTGDVARLDPEGRIHIVDRIKDVVIRGGENVYCGEVEAALHGLPGVEVAAVIGVADEALGEAVAAVVRFAPGEEPASAALATESLHGRLARFKIPTLVAVADADLPRNATGKILKAELRTALTGATPGDVVEVVGRALHLRVLE